MSSQGTGTPAANAERRISAKRIRVAWVIALAADVVEVPLFTAPAIGAVLTDCLDVAVGITLIALVGWHWAFLPTFVAELVPGLDLVPTWTVAVWLATRGRAVDSGNAGAIEGPKP